MRESARISACFLLAETPMLWMMFRRLTVDERQSKEPVLVDGEDDGRSLWFPGLNRQTIISSSGRVILKCNESF